MGWRGLKTNELQDSQGYKKYGCHYHEKSSFQD